MHNTCKATIDLSAIRHNLLQIEQFAPMSKVMAVIKADAYGHGIIETALALTQSNGLAVARLSEAIRLRHHGIKKRILLLGSLLTNDNFSLCAEHQIDIVIHSQDAAQRLIALDIPHPINIWLKLDVGMHRLGLNPAQFRETLLALKQSSNIAEITLMSHFSSADENNEPTTKQQLSLFKETTDNHQLPRSIANSAAIITQPDSHLDWIRPGILLYGANPLEFTLPLQLQPAMTLTANIIAIREIDANRGVGYNHQWKSDTPIRLATVGIGYADGYPRHAANGTPVLINGQKAALAGRVSMDLITIDISRCNRVDVGDEVVLWGEGLPIEEIARHANTISYDLLTSVSERVTKEYIDPNPAY